MPRYAYANGRFLPHNQASVHIEDRGYQFADGVYEVVPVHKGQVVDEEPHLDRLERSLSEGFGELIEAEALETSSLVGVPIKDARLPEGVLIGAIVRGKRIVIPRGETVVRAGDRVIIFSTTSSVKKVERLFSVKLEFF